LQSAIGIPGEHGKSVKEYAVWGSKIGSDTAKGVFPEQENAKVLLIKKGSIIIPVILIACLHVHRLPKKSRTSKTVICFQKCKQAII